MVSSTFGLLMTLHRLKKHTQFTDLSLIYNVSVSFIHKVFLTTVIVIASRSKFINWDSLKDIKKNALSMFGLAVVGAIDCTSHFIIRFHPGTGTYYRTDKKGHFISCQCICSLFGKILSYSFYRGHNNDQSIFNHSQINDFLNENSIYLLADKGYHSPTVIRPELLPILKTK